MDDKLIYRQEAYLINGACMEVYRMLGNGSLEAVYQECLAIEFSKHGIPFCAQRSQTLTYQGQLLRQTYRPDFVCYNKIIVEFKAVSKLIQEHSAQVTNYLKATNFQLGILYNFGHHSLIEIVRIPHIKDRQAL